MSLPSRCPSWHTLSRLPFRTRTNFSRRFVSNDSTNSIPPPKRLRELRAKEHRLRKSILGGIVVATGVGYYLDGKYNARAIRRTLRTAWVGATLAADYKWNFTFVPHICQSDEIVPRRLTLSRNCISGLRG